MTKFNDFLKSYYIDYLGDEAWIRFVNTFPEVEQSILDKIPFDDDISRVIYYKKNSSFKWIQEYLEYKVPAFGGLTPLEVFALDNGYIVLRAALMQMH